MHSDFKMEKSVLDRRLEQIRSGGVLFQPACMWARISARPISARIRRCAAAAGAEAPRDLKVPDGELAASTSPWTFCHSRTSAMPVIRVRDQILATASVWLSSAGAIQERTAWAPATGRRQFRAAIRIMPRRPASAIRTPWPMCPCSCARQLARRRRARDWAIRHHALFRRWTRNVKQLHAVRVGPPNEVRSAARPADHGDAKSTWFCLPWDSQDRCGAGIIEQFGIELMLAAMWPRREITWLGFQGFLLRADTRRGNRWS